MCVIYLLHVEQVILFSQQAYSVLTAKVFATCLVRDIHKQYAITRCTQTISNVSNFQQPVLLRYYIYVKHKNLNFLFPSELSSLKYLTISILLIKMSV